MQGQAEALVERVRPRRTSRTSVNSTLSDHYEYEGVTLRIDSRKYSLLVRVCADSRVAFMEVVTLLPEAPT